MSAYEPDRPSRRRIYVFYSLLVVAFFQAGLYAARSSLPDNFPVNTDLKSDAILNAALKNNSRVLGALEEHPITLLMDDAEKQFRNKLSRQSRSLKAAVAEYKRRFGRAPPKGFDAWWKFVEENGVKMVDEFNGLMEDLAPFMDMSGEQFRARAAQVCSLVTVHCRPAKFWSRPLLNYLVWM